METTESNIWSFLVYMYFADISIANSGAYAHVYHLFSYMHTYII